MPVIFTKVIKDKNEKYFELDGAGIIYPYVATKDWNSVYRVEAKIKNGVNSVCVEQAVNQMKKKYPYYFSRIGKKGNKYVLKQGYTCNVLKKNAETCVPFDLKDEEALIRVVYTKNTIGVEFFHTITDGHGAQMFLNELLKEYLNASNSHYEFKTEAVDTVKANVIMQNTNDMFKELYNIGGKCVSRFLSKAYQFDNGNETALRSESVNIYTPSLINAAHSYGASVTQYLCAIQIASIIRTENVGNKPIRISVPVDLRKRFGLDSPRNASLYILVEVNPQSVTDFTSIVNAVKDDFRKKLTNENMLNTAYTNVKNAKSKAFALLPLSLKKFVLNIGYTVFGENQFTSTLTNLGALSFAPGASNIIDEVRFVLGKQKTKPLNITVSSFKDKTKLVISTTLNNDRFEKSIRELLTSDGVTDNNYFPDEKVG